MKNKKVRRDGTNLFVITLFTLAGVVWSFFVLLFLKDNIMVDKYHVIISCITAVGSVFGMYEIFKWIVSKSKSNILNYCIALFIFTAVFVVIVIFTPYSPNHDSYDLEIILEAMKSGENLGDYLRAYMNFFVTNKLVIYIYYPFVSVAKTVEQGVRIANGIFIWIACVCISFISARIRNIKAAELSLVVMIILCPVLLFSGPYIYPPAIMLSSISLLLYMNKEPVIPVFGYLFAGILFTVRPMSLGVFLVYVVCDTFYKVKQKRFKLLFPALKIVFVFAACLITQWYIGQIMYVTGNHPSESLDSAMGLWTLEVGTRNQGVSTGFCEYSPGGVSEERVDSISQNFSDLWYLYLEPNGKNEEINMLKDKIGIKLIERVKNEILCSAESFADFFSVKYANYYRDYYKPYFYAVNINHENKEELLLKNYDYRYFIYENTLLVLFYIIGMFGCIGACVRIYRKKSNSDEEHAIIIFFFGTICTSIISILCTEVGKRLIFDSFVPMCTVICTSLVGISSRIENAKPKPLLAALLTGICIFTQNQMKKNIEIPIFKNCEVEVDEKRNVCLKFDEPVGNEGYIYVTRESEEISMIGWDTLSVEYGSEEYSARPVLFGIKLPSGQHLYISYLE